MEWVFDRSNLTGNPSIASMSLAFDEPFDPVDNAVNMASTHFGRIEFMA
jgi:hypothetical protein